MKRDTGASGNGPAANYSLGPAEVHVWLCHRDRVADSDVLRRTLLSRYAPLAPGEWRFQRGPWGKPAIANAPLPLDFNLSDSGEWLACAISPGLPLGIDLECFRARRDVGKLARRFFHPTEVAALERATEAQEEAIFYDFWTLKEAHVKCRGLPLPPALESVAFELCDSAGIRRHGADEVDESAYCLLEPLPAHRLALNWVPAAATTPVLRFFRFGRGEATPWERPGLRRASRALEVLPRAAARD